MSTGKYLQRGTDKDSRAMIDSRSFDDHNICTPIRLSTESEWRNRRVDSQNKEGKMGRRVNCLELDRQMTSNNNATTCEGFHKDKVNNQYIGEEQCLSLYRLKTNENNRNQNSIKTKLIRDSNQLRKILNNQKQVEGDSNKLLVYNKRCATTQSNKYSNSKRLFSPMQGKQNYDFGKYENPKCADKIKQKLLDIKQERRPSQIENKNKQPYKSHQIKIIEKVGEGAFGEVFKARMDNRIVAVKRVFQDPLFKNRQLEILSIVKSDFTLNVIDTFQTQEKTKGREPKHYLNIIMQYYEQDLGEANSQSFTPIQIKLLMYQLFRGLMYIHSLNICHRDIKPQNLMINNKNLKLVICDFGSAKVLVKGEENIAYISSRCYRAPELIFGCTDYTTMIDIWSAGCVLLELLRGQPVFRGDTNIGQLIQIIKILGTPSKTQVVSMNHNYDLDNYKFPKVSVKQWRDVFPNMDKYLEGFLKQIVTYSPKQRLSAGEALCHEYFDELREQSVYKYLREKKQIPHLFNFNKEQLRGNEHLMPKLIPDWFHVNNDI